MYSLRPELDDSARVQWQLSENPLADSILLKLSPHIQLQDPDGHVQCRSSVPVPRRSWARALDVDGDPAPPPAVRDSSRRRGGRTSKSRGGGASRSRGELPPPAGPSSNSSLAAAPPLSAAPSRRAAATLEAGVAPPEAPGRRAPPEVCSASASPQQAPAVRVGAGQAHSSRR